MKNASTACKNILATGQYLRADLYDILLVTGTTLRYTNSDAPVNIGAGIYQTGLTIKRGKLTQKAGLEVQAMPLDIAPQGDNPAGAVQVGGLPFLSAARAGFFDGARVTMYKAFLASWTDTSPGNVPWFQGRVADVKVGRFAATLNVNSDTELLNVAMPRNLIQTGCVHTLYDAGCTLSRLSFQTVGTVATAPSSNEITSGLSQADGYFALGVILFTSGALSNRTFTVKQYKNASGRVTTIAPLTGVAPGDTFVIYAGCDKQQATCNTKFSNLSHFRGYPYVPVPETLYDGGTQVGQVATIGGQGGAPAGSPTYGAPTDQWVYPPGS